MSVRKLQTLSDFSVKNYSARTVIIIVQHTLVHISWVKNSEDFTLFHVRPSMDLGRSVAARA